MTEGEFPFRSFTMRAEGYDRIEVDSYVEELQGEITELRRAIETATHSSGDSGDIRLHDPEGAVTRTLAIAQETADRVLHDAQVEADRRRAEADEHATNAIADAEHRAARLLGDMEAQAAEVREQGVAAARSAIQVERDKAMAELAQVRRVRDDLRNEAAELKATLDRYRSQAREASDTLTAMSGGTLAASELPDFIDDEVVLAGIATQTEVDDIIDTDEDADDADAMQDTTTPSTAATPAAPGVAEHPANGAESEKATAPEGAHLRSVGGSDGPKPLFAADDGDDDDALAEVISIDGDEDDDAAEGGFGGTFLAEVRAAAEDDDVALSPENDESDRFLSELRGIAGQQDADLDGDAADTFFDEDAD